jgi:hypothetical protein
VKAVRSRLTYANVVATLALILAVGGATAFAATQLAKNSVGAKQLKKNAVTGEKVKDGSLTGADIGGPVASATSATRADSASTAGRATSAATADSATRAAVADNATHASSADTAGKATDADKLGGALPSAYLASSSVQQVNSSLACATCSGPLFSGNGFSLTAQCQSVGGGQYGLIVNGPASSRAWIFGSPGTGVVAEEPPFASGSATPLVLNGAGKTFQGQLIVRSLTHTLSFNFAVTSSGGACTTAGMVVSA